jgi:hypothetical protein
METIERTETPTAPLDDAMLMLNRRSRMLGWLAGILAVAVVAMGAWMIFGDDGGQSLTAEQEQMIETVDAYLDSWNTGDGAAAAALMSPSGYHDNGSRYFVRDGQLAAFIEQVHGMNFSVSRTGDAAFVGNYVMTTEHIPATSTTDRPSIYKMSTDGTTILWHHAP